MEPVHVSEKAVCKAEKAAFSMSSIDHFMRHLVISGSNIVLIWSKHGALTVRPQLLMNPSNDYDPPKALPPVPVFR